MIGLWSAVGLLRARRIPDMPAVCEGMRCTVLPPNTFPDDAGEPALRIAMLGDSLLAGAGAPDAESALPLQLGRLAAAALDAPVRIENHARSGARAADVRRLQVAELAATQPGVTCTDLKAQVGERFRREPELFAEDRFHPSAAGYACIAEALAPALLTAHAEAEPPDASAEVSASRNISVAS